MTHDQARQAEPPAGLRVEVITKREAATLVVDYHYLHRKPPMSFVYGLKRGPKTVGVVTFGTPPSRHLQMGACPSDPAMVIELNRLWVHDDEPANTESWFVSRALKLLPPRIVVSYADTVHGHLGFIYRALNFHYAGWTDMDRKTPRYDYIPEDPTKHTREASRSGCSRKVRRLPKVKYWITTGNKAERKALMKLCGWPLLDWHTLPPPVLETVNIAA